MVGTVVKKLALHASAVDNTLSGVGGLGRSYGLNIILI